MANKPFVDRSQLEVGAYIQVVSSSGGIDTTQVDRFRQGVNIRGFQDYRLTLIPFVNGSTYPDSVGSKFPLEMEPNAFGQPKLFEDPAPALRSGVSKGPGPAPFDDIAGIMDPVQYIKDTGTQQYPVVDLSPNYLDPAQMDGVIEPLAIRQKMSNTMAEGPYEAHAIRAALQPESGPNLLGKGTEITRFIEFYPPSPTEMYFDSQNVEMENANVRVPGMGYAHPPARSLRPFDDAMLREINPTDIDFSSFEVTGTFRDLGSFIGDPRFGILGKAATSGFIYETGTRSPATEIRLSTNRRVNGADSVAFGGLLK